MYISKIDGTECKNLLGLKTHLNKYKLTIVEYMIKYDNFIIPKCICGKECKLKKANIFRKTCGSQECINKLREKIVYTEEQREKARQNRFNYLKLKTGKTAWERRAAGEMSYLEQWFFDEIIKKFNLSHNYDIVMEYPIYPYFIDFAFLNINVAVEMDGRCHFTNGKNRIEHDIKRDKILNEKGWLIYRIKFDEINEITVNNFLNFLNTREINDKTLPAKTFLYKEIKPKKQETTKRLENNLKRDEIQKEFIPIILNSNIIFNKIGWVQQVSKIINKKVSKVPKWMKYYMPEFYETNCFKRKNKK